jgi:hypothetical protein
MLEQLLLALQAFQVLFLWFHDWIPLGRLNDVTAVRRQDTPSRLVLVTLIQSVPFTIGLFYSARYLHQSGLARYVALDQLRPAFRWPNARLVGSLSSQARTSESGALSQNVRKHSLISSASQWHRPQHSTHRAALGYRMHVALSPANGFQTINRIEMHRSKSTTRLTMKTVFSFQRCIFSVES